MAKHQGCWLLADNGCLNWSTTIPPMKISFDRQECRWLEWIESLRKDVECAFETLKGRWRILKLGICPHGTKNADAAFKTCCAMRSWLLEVDGLDEEWEQGVPSMWQGESGNFEDDDMASEQARASHRLRTGSSRLRSRHVPHIGFGLDRQRAIAMCQAWDWATTFCLSTMTHHRILKWMNLQRVLAM